MIAEVIAADGAGLGVHLTYLAPDGSGKYPFVDTLDQRESRGPIRGGAVRLAAHNYGRELIVAEGIETALSCMTLFDRPAWAALSASGLKSLDLPNEIRRVIVAGDHDKNGVGQRAAVSAFYRFKAEGRAVRLVIPPEPGTDFNDVLRARGDG
jgi:hypothetical protein